MLVELAATVAFVGFIIKGVNDNTQEEEPEYRPELTIQQMSEDIQRMRYWIEKLNSIQLLKEDVERDLERDYHYNNSIQISWSHYGSDKHFTINASEEMLELLNSEVERYTSLLGKKYENFSECREQISEQKVHEPAGKGRTLAVLAYKKYLEKQSKKPDWRRRLSKWSK